MLFTRFKEVMKSNLTVKSNPWKGKRIGVLMGGMSAERSISITTGEGISTALESRGYSVARIYVDRDVDQVLRVQKPDVAFIALHGTYGEDGCIQGLLELLEIPYTGSGVLASALAMDKVKAKEMFRLHNVPTPPYYVLDADEIGDIEERHGSFGFPAFVKPRRQGSSVGAGKAESVQELRKRCEDSAQYDRSILVERFVRGHEVHVGILNGRALGAIEIVPKSAFYDYKSKYQSSTTEYHLPARLPPARYKGILTIAERASECLGSSGATRVDMLVTEGENEYTLEVNTVPGMTPTSLLPKIAAGVGISYADLCEEILTTASLDRDRSAPRERLPLRTQASPPKMVRSHESSSGTIVSR